MTMDVREKFDNKQDCKRKNIIFFLKITQNSHVNLEYLIKCQ